MPETPLSMSATGAKRFTLTAEKFNFAQWLVRSFLDDIQRTQGKLISWELISHKQKKEKFLHHTLTAQQTVVMFLQ